MWELAGPVVKIIDFGLSRLRLDSGEVLYNDKAKLRDLFSPSADFEQVAVGLGTLKVSDWDAAPAAERDAWRDLRRRLLKGAFQTSDELVRHRFFESLRLKPRTKSLPPVPSFSAPKAPAPAVSVAASVATAKKETSAPLAPKAAPPEPAVATLVATVKEAPAAAPKAPAPRPVAKSETTVPAAVKAAPAPPTIQTQTVPHTPRAASPRLVRQASAALATVPPAAPAPSPPKTQPTTVAATEAPAPTLARTVSKRRASEVTAAAPIVATAPEPAPTAAPEPKAKKPSARRKIAEPSPVKGVTVGAGNKRAAATRALSKIEVEVASAVTAKAAPKRKAAAPVPAPAPARRPAAAKSAPTAKAAAKVAKRAATVEEYVGKRVRTPRRGFAA